MTESATDNLLQEKDALIAELVEALKTMTDMSGAAAEYLYVQGARNQKLLRINEEIAAARAVLDRAKEQKP